MLQNYLVLYLNVHAVRHRKVQSITYIFNWHILILDCTNVIFILKFLFDIKALLSWGYAGASETNE